MRNYISVWFQLCHLSSASCGDSDFVLAGADEKDLVIEQEKYAAAIDPSCIPFEITVTTTVQTFMLLDKDSVLRFCKINAAGVYFTSVVEQRKEFQVFRNVLETPRYDGWTDRDGNVRKPAPSDRGKGKGTKIVPPESLLQSLENLVGLMVRAGFKNTPGGLIARAVAVILAIIKGQPVDGKAVGILINEIIGALSN